MLPEGITCVRAGDRVSLRHYLIQAYQQEDTEQAGAVALFTAKRSSKLELCSQFFSHETNISADSDRPIACLAPRLDDWKSLAVRLVTRGPGQRNPMSPAAERLLLSTVLDDCHRTGRVRYFQRLLDTRGFLDSLMTLLKAWQRFAVRPEQLHAAARLHHRPEKILECVNIYERYLAAQDEFHFLDEARLYWEAARIIQDNAMQGHEGVPIRCLLIESIEADPGAVELVVSLARTVPRIVVALKQFSSIPMQPSPVDEVLSRLEASGLQRQPSVTLEERPRPEGIRVLHRSLFANESHDPSSNADGVSLVQAAGMLGEARQVARAICHLLRQGSTPGSIVITAPDLCCWESLLPEVLEEYQIPWTMEFPRSRIRDVGASLLLRALRLPDADWPFRDLTEILRSTLLRPRWNVDKPDIALRAETFLRMLGETQGKDNYLRGLYSWADTPPAGLEDEQAEASRRRRQQRLARECRTFLERFFAVWNDYPREATLKAWLEWTKQFALELGFVHSSDATLPATGILGALADLRAWHSATHRHRGVATLGREEFLRLLTLVLMCPADRQPALSLRSVRVVTPETAGCLTAEHLFVIGLEEGSFPRLASEMPLLDESERECLRSAKIAVATTNERLIAEQDRFLALVAMPQKSLTLSYPAVDEKGQTLLPSSFLRAVQSCFQANVLPVCSQRMLLDRYFDVEAFSLAELRVQHARAVWANPDRSWTHPDLSPELCEHLAIAAEVARQRFMSKEFGIYDGMFQDPERIALLADRFGAEKVLSPTSLEAYVSCPFRFLMESVLHLEALEHPSEEVEHTRRGSAFHRALARFHKQIMQDVASYLEPTGMAKTADMLAAELDRAIEEYANRAPSPASRTLWYLEGKRLKRAAVKYGLHWHKFVTPWKAAGLLPEPRYLEVDFGVQTEELDQDLSLVPLAPLELQGNNMRVRIGGRIDRIDVAETRDEVRFWIIDYKTGKGNYYRAADLLNFEKLQLSLYAIAVERLFFTGRVSRPLGLAYWLVTDSGPKPVLPDQRKLLSWFENPSQWQAFRNSLEATVVALVERIRRAEFPLAPQKDDCTSICPYKMVCRITQSRHVGKARKTGLPVIHSCSSGETG